MATRRTRKAHVLARHTCGKGETSFADAKGCGCGPLYYIRWRKLDGKWERKMGAGRNRREVEAKLAEVNADLAADPPRDPWARRPKGEGILFATVADDWLEGLRNPKESTVDDYRVTVKYAKAAWVNRTVDSISAQDILMFAKGLGAAETRKAGATTQRKHLRHLHQFFEWAKRRKLVTESPFDFIDSSELPKADAHPASWFEDDELRRIALAIGDRVYRVMFQLAYRSGLRSGELVGLSWGDLALSGEQPYIHVRRTYKEGRGFQTAKSRASVRKVYLTQPTAQLLREWHLECGRPDADTIVFPGNHREGVVRASDLTRRVLYPAMVTAGVPRPHPDEGGQRTWHSLRHTNARMLIEASVPLKALSEHLGHSSWGVTDKTYSHISAKYRQAATSAVSFAV